MEMLKLIQTSLVSWETLQETTIGLGKRGQLHFIKPRSSKAVPPFQ
jgi:hypothetical protein